MKRIPRKTEKTRVFAKLLLTFYVLLLGVFVIQPRSYAAVPVEGGTVAPASVHPVQTVQPIEESKPAEKPKSQKTQVEEKHGTGNLQQGTSGSNSSTHVNGSSSEAVPLKNNTSDTPSNQQSNHVQQDESGSDAGQQIGTGISLGQGVHAHYNSIISMMQGNYVAGLSELLLGSTGYFMGPSAASTVGNFMVAADRGFNLYSEAAKYFGWASKNSFFQTFGPASNLKYLGTVAKGSGILGGILAVGGGINDIVNGDDGYTKFAGGLGIVGGIAGAAALFFTGPVALVLGGVALVGALGAAFLKSEFGKKAIGWVKDKAVAAYNAVKDGAKAVYGAAKATYSKAKAKAKALYSKAKTKVKAFAGKAKQKAKAAYNYTKSKVKAGYAKVKQKAKAAYNYAKSKVKAGYAKVKQKAKAAYNYAKSKVKAGYAKAKKKAKAAYNYAKSKVKAGYAKVKQKAKAAYNYAKSKVKAGYAKVKKKAKAAYNYAKTKVKSVARGVKSKAKSAYSNVKSSISQKASGLRKRAGGFLKRLGWG